MIKNKQQYIQKNNIIFIPMLVLLLKSASIHVLKKENTTSLTWKINLLISFKKFKKI